jgi:hypothetical protein
LLRWRWARVRSLAHGKPAHALARLTFFFTTRERSNTPCDEAPAHLSLARSISGSSTALQAADVIVVYVEQRLVLSTPAK